MSNDPVGSTGEKGSQSGTLFRDAAERLLDQGYSPIPVVGKAPAVKGWQRYGEHAPSPRVVERWAAQFPGHNVGAACGRLVALDIDGDSADGAFDLQRRAFRAFGETPLIRIGRAPRRVLLYRAKEPFATVKRPLVQVLADGSQVVLFGTHPVTGGAYSWPEETPLYVACKDLPIITAEGARAWADAAPSTAAAILPVTPPAPRRLAPLVAAGSIEEGYRNEYLFREARTLARAAVSEDDLLGRLIQINGALCAPPLAVREVRATARSVWRYRELNRLFVLEGVANAVVTSAEFGRLTDDTDALSRSGCER